MPTLAAVLPLLNKELELLSGPGNKIGNTSTKRSKSWSNLL